MGLGASGIGKSELYEISLLYNVEHHGVNEVVIISPCGVVFQMLCQMYVLYFILKILCLLHKA